MTNNSKRLKRLKKYSHITKRCKYRCKKSIRNKILYGGVDRPFKFSVGKDTISANQYILTKKRPIFSFKAGIGTYQLDEKISGTLTSIIDPCTLEMFIKGLEQIKKFSPAIFNALYTTLKTESLKDSFNFNFKSLLQHVEQIAPTEIQQPNVDNDKISIAGFSELPNTSETDQNYIKLKNIYDILIKQTDLIKLKEAYQDFPLLKIDPTLPTLIETGGATPIGEGSFGKVYKVTIASKQYALKQIKAGFSISNLMNSEVIAYNTISQLVCDKKNTLFCKLIRAYVDFTSYKIYVLMEYCGDSLEKKIVYISSLLEPDDITPLLYKWLLNTATGLQCMHQSKYAHLDIKPANIVIDTTTKNSKIIDFGLIFKFNTYKPLGGTLIYMPPEQINKSYDQRNPNVEKFDVYSLGITFIECAFALNYNKLYNDVKEYTDQVMFLSILRYFPPENVEEKDNVTFPTFQKVDGDYRLIDTKYTMTSIISEKSVYTNSDVCEAIQTIHSIYPIFRRMILKDPTDRCSIDEVIAECNQKLTI